ncbi:MAG TPA: GNAT family N-acetyltransferase [Acidimicrobiales bacterium]
MSWSPRLIRPDELPAVVDLLALGFGEGPVAPPEIRAAVEAVAEVDRTFVVEDEGRLVGTAAAYTFNLALPGGTVPMAAVTEVAVSPTHRRRGLLTALLEAVHDQALQRGEPLAGLTASEGGIYRRFGYGVATRYHQVRIDAHRSAELTPLRVAGAGDGSDPRPGAGRGHAAHGRIRFVSEDEAAGILPAVWDRHWRRTPGEVDRTAGYWAEHALDTPQARAGASARFIAVHDDAAGQPDGFAVYRIAQDSGPTGTSQEARLVWLAAASDPVEAALLRFVLDVDLVGTVTWSAPVDMPLRWRLADPRAVTVTAERDLLWLRPLDVPRCLAARRYAAEGEVVIAVVDDRRDAGGRFRLAGGPAGAVCERTGDVPDLTLAVADLGALLAGGTTWDALARAGRIVEHRAGTVDRADAMFRPERAAYCSTDF